jgi:hypothetical protein
MFFASHALRITDKKPAHLESLAVDESVDDMGQMTRDREAFGEHLSVV